MIAAEALTVELPLPAGALTLRRRIMLDGISLRIGAGEILAVVGESGTGKSLLALALLGLLPPGARRGGRILLDGACASDAQLRAACGRQIAFAPQSLSFLDPTASVGRQIAWAARRAGATGTAGAVTAQLTRFGLPDSTAALFPHQLSGGMARRVLLALATAGRPRLLLVDEPTAGLDDANAERIGADLRRIAADGAAILLVTHDLPLALRCAARVALLREGRMAGIADADSFTKGGPGPLARHANALWRALPENGMRIDA